MPENLYDALRESHVVQRSLLRRLLRSKAGTQARIGLFTRVRIELETHEAAEERFLYAPMLMDDTGLSAARHALHEHHQIDELVEDVQGLDAAGAAWLEKAKELSQKVHHHLREEERRFFQVSGKILGATHKARLVKAYRRDYARMHEKLSAS